MANNERLLSDNALIRAVRHPSARIPNISVLKSERDATIAQDKKTASFFERMVQQLEEEVRQLNRKTEKEKKAAAEFAFSSGISMGKVCKELDDIEKGMQTIADNALVDDACWTARYLLKDWSFIDNPNAPTWFREAYQKWKENK